MAPCSRPSSSSLLQGRRCRTPSHTSRVYTRPSRSSFFRASSSSFQASTRNETASGDTPPDLPVKQGASRFWIPIPAFLCLLFQPGTSRRTTRTELVKGQIWGFDQLQGVLNVLVNVRMTVVRMKNGNLLVYSPIAPTEECLQLVRELGGEVEYIILPTTALEHKIYFGPFARKFPKAKAYAAPGQWSFPVPLPLSFLGLGFRRLDGTLTDEASDFPFADEFDLALLEAPLGIGPYVECAFYHKRSRTMLLVDAAVCVPNSPPTVARSPENDRTLLIRARQDVNDGASYLGGIVDDYDRAVDQVPRTDQKRQEGWWKTALFALFFQPSDLDFDFVKAFVNQSADSGFVWRDSYKSTFQNLSEKVIVAPILQALVFNKRPTTVANWVKKVSSWGFDKFIPCHFDAPVKATGRDIRLAFASFLDEDLADLGSPQLSSALDNVVPTRALRSSYNKDDMKILNTLDTIVVASGVVKLEKKQTTKGANV